MLLLQHIHTCAFQCRILEFPNRPSCHLCKVFVSSFAVSAQCSTSVCSIEVSSLRLLPDNTLSVCYPCVCVFVCAVCAVATYRPSRTCTAWYPIPAQLVPDWQLQLFIIWAQQHSTQLSTLLSADHDLYDSPASAAVSSTCMPVKV